MGGKNKKKKKAKQGAAKHKAPVLEGAAAVNEELRRVAGELGLDFDDEDIEVPQQKKKQRTMNDDADAEEAKSSSSDGAAAPPLDKGTVMMPRSQSSSYLLGRTPSRLPKFSMHYHIKVSRRYFHGYVYTNSLKRALPSLYHHEVLWHVMICRKGEMLACVTIVVALLIPPRPETKC